MKPFVLVFLLCVAFLVVTYLLFEVLVFRLACRLARVPPPTAGRTVGLTFVVVAVAFVVEGILAAAVERAYSFGGFPLWEAGLVGFFLGLPVHMLLASAIHAKMLGVTMGEALGVWFVEKSMKLAMVALAAGLFGALVLLQRVNA